MKISVVIPAYNAALTIDKAIQSVVKQDLNFKKIVIDVIVVNDGSTDMTLQVVQEIINKHNSIKIQIFSKKNEGVSKARNYGISKSEGDWIAFLDSDDEWLPTKLKEQIRIIDSLQGKVDFIGCARNDESLQLLGRKVDKLYKAEVNDLLIKMFPQTSTALVRKELLNLVGGYNEEMTHSEDGELWVRLCGQGDFYYMPESLVRTGGGKANYGSSGLSANLKKMHEGSLEILNTALRLNYINGFQYISLYIFYTLKYIRRILIVKVKKK
ncbi:glycosyltransferase family 2 protein [Photobacterium sp. Hal280]|uniref:glycosyltransferase family 2 protein n=1 Tax=Photobacterium sp. Hal280 TaxID=3035163 RepID=UPI00301C6FD7